ncbi:MAG: GSU2403 family nucleotidyltransferase fold protein [Reyranellaceae bacterium]
MPPAAGSLTLAFQTTYAELLEQCSSDAFGEAFPEAGTFVAKDVAGRRYWYFQMPASQGQKQKYVGPETAELLERIDRHRNARRAERTRQSLVATLVRSAGLPRPLPRIGEIVAALAQAGVFRLRGVLVGTVAYQTYPGLLGQRLPIASMQTSDVDIAQFHNVSVAVEDATPPMLEILEGIDASFRPVPRLHRTQPSVTYVASDNVRVDFLTPNKGSDTDTPRRLAALGTHAEPLRFLDFLIHAPEPAVVLHGAGILVSVPAPERYAVHKLIVAQRRVGSVNVKRAKDMAQAAALLARLVEARPAGLRAVWQEAQGRGARWADYLYAGLAEIDPIVRDRTLAAVGEVRARIPGLDLAFDDTAPREDFERDAFFLWADAGKQRVRCLVSRATVDDAYGADGLGKEGRLATLRENRPEIEALLRQKYLHDPVEEPASVTLKSQDVGRLRSRIARAKPPRTRQRVKAAPRRKS